MKRWLLCVIAAVMVASGAAVALAAVEGTHHDMGTYLGSGAGADACYSCHGYKQGGAVVAGLGNIGNMCYLRCHVGAGGVSGTIPLANAYPEIGIWDNTNNRLTTIAMGTAPYTGASTPDKYTQGHKFATALIPAPDTQAMVAANTAWPYTAGATMECTSCHDVHSNTYAPFLRLPLSDNTTRANAFCHKCHGAVTDGAARWVDEYSAGPNGAHPSEAGYGAANYAAMNGSGTTRLGRTIEFKDYPAPAAVNDNGVFRNFSHAGTALGSNANHYNPGGKLGNLTPTATSFGLSGNVGCYTCHATHLPAAAGMGQLTVARYLAAGTYTQSDLCVGCHGSSATQGRNPGTTNFWHPVDRETRVVSFATPAAASYQVTTGSFNITVNMTQGSGAGTVFDNGVGGTLSCLSCHGGGLTAGNHNGVHNALAGTSILSPTKPNCSSCHNVASAQMGTTPNSHHVYGGNRGAVYATMGYPTTVTYSTGFVADLSNGLSCEDCHISAQTTAHNWN